jgi:hypothetical protein
MGFGLVIGVIVLLNLVTAGNYNSFTDLHTLNNSLWHALSPLSLLRLHWLLPGNAPNTIDPSAAVFLGSGPHWLAPISLLS